MEDQTSSANAQLVESQGASAPAKVETVRSLLAKDAYKARFQEILGKRSGQFCAALVQISNSYQLRQCNPHSVIAAAITAASLDLPIDKNLGFAHIVPYKGVANFQMGYKGFIQLALRSGQFKSMRDAKVNAEAFTGYDNITGDPKIDWTKIDDSKVPVGYAFAWRLTNGFEKIVYWTREAVEAHAKRFSQAYKANKKDSPWITDFDSMALKTVIKAALAKWAPLSTEMQQAIIRDESAQATPDDTPIYPDGVPLSGDNPEEVRKPVFGEVPGEPAKPAEEKAPEKKPAASKAKKSDDSHPDLDPAKPAEPPADPKEREAVIEQMKERMLDNNVTEARLFKSAVASKLVPEGVTELWSLPTAALKTLKDVIITLNPNPKQP